MNVKSDLRSSLIEIRQIFVKSQNYSWHHDTKWPPSLTALARITRCIGGYIAVKSEVDATSLLHLFEAEGCALALPYLPNREAKLEFRGYRRGDELEKAPFGFQQPLATANAVHPDVILTPLIGFDRQMNRLGQGGGHYDRYFAAHRQPLRIGIAWSVQAIDHITADPWDIPLDAVLTEKEWILGPHSRIITL